MHRAPRLFVAVALVVMGLTGTASAQILVREPFNGTGPMPSRWRQTDAEWQVVSGAAKVVVSSVDRRTRIGYATVDLGGAHRQGLRVVSAIRFSPTHANVGLVAPFRDRDNHLFCKIERTPAHPKGFMAIGRRIGGAKPELMARKDMLGLEAGGAYRVELTRRDRAMTCSVSKRDRTFGSLNYRMTLRDIRRYGGGDRAGIRIRVVARGDRRDEDDGRSRFLNFTAKTIA